MRNVTGAIIGAVLIGCANLAGAEIFKIKYIDEGSRSLETKDKSGDKLLWQSQVKLGKTESEGKTYVYVTEDGTGIYGGNKNYNSWHSEAYYYFGKEKLTPYQTNLVFKDKNGKVVRTINKFYDPERKKAICTIDGKTKEFDLKDDLIDKEMLGTALQNYPFEEKRDFVFHLLTNEPTLYKITIKYRGRESLKALNREIECHKLEMIPDLGVLNIFGVFVPKTYFWYKADFPHEFLKYEGLDGGLGTPYVVTRCMRYCCQ